MLINTPYYHAVGKEKDVFEHAYKKERYLDMKLHALRGISQFISEKEIKKLIVKFLQLINYIKS